MNPQFKTYPQQNLVETQKNVSKHWKDMQIFEKSIETKPADNPYVFYEGPPSANGLPGIHHVMARTIKDLFCRFHTLKGQRVSRKAGWDTHGLPIELSVEKELGITKEDIGTKISVDEYNAQCKKTVMQYTDVWNRLTEEMGYWVDMDNPYITYDNKYIESVWWLLGQIYKKDYLYKGYTIQPFSPKAGTGLSSHELNQPGCYRDVSDTSITAQFFVPNAKQYPVFEELEGDIFILAWTTTPWTLPSNTCLTVNKNINYVCVETFNRYTHQPMKVVLAEALLAKVFGKPYTANPDLDSYQKGGKNIPYRVAKTFKGDALLGVQYDQLFDFVQPHENADKAFQVIHGDHVTTEDGTGVVHTAPTFGADDAKVAADYGIPGLLVKTDQNEWGPLVDRTGKFVKEVTPWAGMYVREEYYPKAERPEKTTDVLIAIDLKERNRAFKVEKYKHSYPHCWRTDKPVLYYPLDSWFVKTTAAKDRLIELNKTINWKPESTGNGRFGKWLENLNDWNLSRSRYWGIPLPIWRTKDNKHELIISSVAELKSEILKSLEKGVMEYNFLEGFELDNMSQENYDQFDLHKHELDKVVLTAPNGDPMYREPDLIDVWFDSGSMPYAQLHYPFENKELVDNRTNYPADFIAEGVDQTRGWFFTLHVIGTLVFDSISYKNVMSNGLILDKNGQKMSKRLGNTIEPFEALNTYGTDTIRWYMISNAQPWENLRFDLEGVDEVRRKFFGTLYNTYSFFALYSNIDKFDPATAKFIPVAERNEMDRWIISELQLLIQKADQDYSDYEPTRATRALQKFVIEDLSNWYVRLNRRRFWKEGVENSKLSAYWTLFECLRDVSIMISPVAPFYSDQLFQDLTANLDYPESVHLADFPTSDSRLIDEALNYKNELTQKLSSMLLSIRKKEKIKVRQPLQKVVIPAFDNEFRKAVEANLEFLKTEVNVKEIELLNEDNEFIVKEAKPNFKTIGPKYGKQMKAIQQQIKALSSEQIKEFEKKNELLLTIDEESILLDKIDIEINTKDIEGWEVKTDGEYTVALDIHINEDLKLEGIARDLVNRIQNLRKTHQLDLTDRITVWLEPEPTLKEVLNQFEHYICSETLTDQIFWESEKQPNAELVELDNLSFNLSITKK